MVFRYYARGPPISDVPCTSQTTRKMDDDACGRVRIELLRSTVREALRTG